MRVTIKQIAAQVGVSPSLVSMYLNQHPLSARIAEATKKRIDAAVAATDYRANATARALRNGRNRTIGLVVANVASGFTAFMLQSLMNETARHGYLLLIAVTNYDENENRCLENLLNRQTDGILYPLHYFGDERTDALLEQYPLLQMRNEAHGFNTIWIDYDAAISAAMTALHARGCRKIALIGGQYGNLPPASCRTACAQYALEFTHLPYHEYADHRETVLTALARLSPDAVLLYSRIDAAALLREYPGGNPPIVVYSYSRPIDFIANDRVGGVFYNPMKEYFAAAVTRIVAMVEGKNSNKQALKVAARFLSTEELTAQTAADCADAYFHQPD